MARATRTNKGMNKGIALLMIVFGVIVAGLVLWGGITLAKQFATGVDDSAATGIDGWLKTVLTIILGSAACTTWAQFAIHISVFMILLFAFTDILIGFSSFSETTSWIIGFGLALIAGATKGLGAIVKIFGFTAGFGAVGVGIIVLSAVFAAVILNMGVGGPLRRWRTARQVELDSLDASKGFGKVNAFIKGAKSGADAASAGEK